MDNPFDAGPQAEIKRVLDAGEVLLWSGRPRRGLLLRASDAYFIPFSLLWGGFAFFWEWSVLTHAGHAGHAGVFMSLWGIPFVLMGAYLILGRFFVDARIRARTCYGLSDRRAILITGLFSRTISSLPLRTLTDLSLQERADRSGTVLLARPLPTYGWGTAVRWPGMAASVTPAFEMIPDAKAVYDQLLRAQREAG